MRDRPMTRAREPQADARPFSTSSQFFRNKFEYMVANDGELT